MDVLDPGEITTWHYIPGETPSFFFTGKPPGAVRLELTLDHTNILTELNEGNNALVLVSITDETTGEELAETDDRIVIQKITNELLGAPKSEKSTDKIEVDQESASTPSRTFNPIILPGNPLYVFKTLAREMQSLFTFDDKKDTELRLDIVK
jgi:hypothetical protein